MSLSAQLSDLTELQLNLLRLICKPEGDAVKNFIESELTDPRDLHDLDPKEKDNTISNIVKLRNNDLNKKQIIYFIMMMNIEWAGYISSSLEDLYDEGIEEDDIIIQCKNVTGLNHMAFQWTSNLVKEAIIVNRQRKYKSNRIAKHEGDRIRLKSMSLGYITKKQRKQELSRFEKDFKQAVMDTWSDDMSATKKQSYKKMLDDDWKIVANDFSPPEPPDASAKKNTKQKKKKKNTKKKGKKKNTKKNLI